MKKKQPIKPVLKEKGFWEVNTQEDVKIVNSPLARFLDKKEKTKPFTVAFNISPEGQVDFNFHFDGFITE